MMLKNFSDCMNHCNCIPGDTCSAVLVWYWRIGLFLDGCVGLEFSKSSKVTETASHITPQSSVRVEVFVVFWCLTSLDGSYDD